MTDLHCQFCHTMTNRSSPKRCDSIDAALKCEWLSRDLRLLLLKDRSSQTPAEEQS